MPVIVDGNNLLHRLPRPQRSRAEVRQRTLELVRHEALKVVVVFDGPPPEGSPLTEHLGRVTVRYSAAAAADDLIIDMVPEGRAASQWVVVTDDRGLRARARSKGASVRTLDQWRGRRPQARRPHHESRLSSHEIAEWEEYFSSGGESDES
jgi:predicted RNA-binding protein with PIN domain